MTTNLLSDISLEGGMEAIGHGILVISFTHTMNSFIFLVHIVVH